ncbi:MAG: lysoplasmalogenase family protein [Pyrinomonadaceae bacterium]
MHYYLSTTVLAAICLANALLYVVADWRGWLTLRPVFKISASTSFVILAVCNGASGTTYGRLILLALLLSWVGDILLLSLRPIGLLAGMFTFFLAHAAFAAAFGSQRLDLAWFVFALFVLCAAALVFVRWLWPYIKTHNRAAVPLYLVAITIMSSLAISAAAASGSPLLAVGAVAFFVSDVSVARDRFVSHGIANKVWGLPLYYAAQLLFGISVLSHG